MDFKFDNKQQTIQNMVREFTAAEVAPLDAKMDETGDFPYEIIAKMGKLGLFGVPYPKSCGGMGGDSLCSCITIEELAKGSASVALTLDAHWLSTDALFFFGSEEQKEQFLYPLIKGEKLAAFAYSEPNAGSDAASIEASGERNRDYWILNGTKVFCTNGGVAQYYIVAVKTEPGRGNKGISTFIVDKDNPGLKIEKIEDKMGCRGSVTARILLQDCLVPQNNLLGVEGEGFKIAMTSFDIGRMHMGAMSLGIAQSAMKAAVDYLNSNEHPGDQQAGKLMLADMAIEIEALRVLLYKTAKYKDMGKRVTKEAAMVKTLGAKIAVKTAKNAIQIMGMRGLTKGSSPQRLFRDTKLLEIGEGAIEILTMLVGSHELRSNRMFSP